MLFLGVDCGTQSLKVLLWDAGGGSIVSAARRYGLIERLPPGHKEQHPSVWIEALESCLDELGAGTDLSRVNGIGVSGQQHGLVLLDRSDQVIRPAKLWNDTSTESECRAILRAAGGLESYRDAIGNGLPPGFTASKVRWVRDREPECYGRIHSILLPHEYLNWYLTGEKTAEPGDASGTGYFDVRARRWSLRALEWIDPGTDLAEKLPRLIESTEAAGRLRRSLAARWGMSRVTVSAGGGDNMMGAIGSGNVRPGVLTVSLGTSGTIYGYSETPVVDPAGEIAAFCDSTGAWLPLGCTMNATVATEMIRNGLLETELEGFERAVESVPAGADGLILLPYLEGERMPDVPDGTGVLLGLRPRTATPAHQARAAMEGATLGLRYGLQRLNRLGLAPSEIRLIGGGAASPIWRQIVACVLGLPVACPANQEGPAFGAALQAAWCVGGGSIRDLVEREVELDESTRVQPDPGQASLYERIYQTYEDLSRTLIDSEVFRRHRSLIRQE